MIIISHQETKGNYNPISGNSKIGFIISHQETKGNYNLNNVKSVDVRSMNAPYDKRPITISTSNTTIPQENSAVNSYVTQEKQNNAEPQVTPVPAQKVVADLSLFNTDDLKNFNTARKKVIEYGREHFPDSVINKDTNMEIGISR